MPFHKEWDPVTEDYVSNRDRTGPPPPPPTGTTVQEDGTIIVANQTIQPQIPPARPVTVTFPGPNEPLVGKDGRITPRWWRFLDELYRRTGGVVDNINKVPVFYLRPSTVSLVITGYAPTVLNPDDIRTPSTASVTLTGQDVTIVNTS